jgi:5-methylcytosine-specific restriction protein B
MILKSREQEFRSLFSEFVEDYFKTSDGENHLRFYDEGRSKGRENFEAVRTSRGDITDSVLRGLLPHTNSVAHRASGAWIHIALTIQGEIKEWFEGAGWTRAEDWPKASVARMSEATSGFWLCQSPHIASLMRATCCPDTAGCCRS